MHEALALAVGDALQLSPLNAGFMCEALQCFRRLAIGVQRNVEIRAEDFRRLLWLCSRHPGEQHGEPARRIQRFRITALKRNAALHQPVDHAIEQRLRQARQRVDGQFLGAKFDQQGLHACHVRHHAATAVARFNPGNPSVSRCA